MHRDGAFGRRSRVCATHAAAVLAFGRVAIVPPLRDRRMRWLLPLLLLPVGMPAQATSPVPAAPAPAATQAMPSTDAWIDAQLRDLAQYATRYRAAFDDELARYQDAPPDLIAQLRADGWSPDRIYAACAMAKTAGRPCRVVADAWARDPGQRWDAVGARFGIAAGSGALQRMKDGIIATYGRWGRPITPDRQR